MAQGQAGGFDASRTSAPVTVHRVRRCAEAVLSDISRFSRLVLRRPLRDYQLEPTHAILDSILHARGLTFAVMMARQAGKNELSAQLEAYLLNLYRRAGGTIVKGSPTYKPQTYNSILRLCDRLDNPWNAHQYHRREGYIVELDAARAFFFSAGPSANVVGATASLLLEGDEVQDIAQEKWDKDFTPMGASTNVTTVFYGTAWTSSTFLARTIAALEEQQLRDGLRRVFRVDADQVAAEVPAYGDFVRSQVARLGRQHPLVKTQFFLEPIDGSGGLFPPPRRALMRGSRPRSHTPEPGHRYSLLIDVAGEDEQEGGPLDRLLLTNPRRDATAITVVEVLPCPSAPPPPCSSAPLLPCPSAPPLPCSSAPLLPCPSAPPPPCSPAQMPGIGSLRPKERLFYVVDRSLYLGAPHAALYAKILALAEHWHAAWVVVDATGVGAGLASFLAKALGDRVTPVEFSPNVKSDLGWDFLALVETGRFQDYADDGAADTRQFWYEVEACTYEIAPGPGKRMKWGVFEPPAYDGLIARGHDDLLISAALCTVVDKLAFPGDAVGQTLATPDPLAEIDQGEW